MKLRNLALLGLGILVLGFALFFFLSRHHRAQRLVSAATWQHMASPGDLSKAHASLENNCAACHTPTKSLPAQKCIVCHANNVALLQRQPTVFHANIADCAPCHIEHQGRIARATQMDHVALAHIGCQMLERAPSPSVPDMAKVQYWLERTAPSARPANHRAAEEALLNCAACHGTKDKHFGLFGADCAACHSTTAWTIPEFRHPSSASQSCAQCHQAPPSHYMEHFQMVSMKVAGQEHADVSQCFLCHQTTSWNDIKGVGFYKHH